MATSEFAVSDPPPKDSLGARVRASRLPPPSVRQRIRRESRIPLREMAVHLAVTPMTVLRWERGEAKPRLGHAIAYRRLLDELEEAMQS